jgi:hypothetical protein
MSPLGRLWERPVPPESRRFLNARTQLLPTGCVRAAPFRHEMVRAPVALLTIWPAWASRYGMFRSGACSGQSSSLYAA